MTFNPKSVAVRTCRTFYQNLATNIHYSTAPSGHFLLEFLPRVSMSPTITRHPNWLWSGIKHEIRGDAEVKGGPVLARGTALEALGSPLLLHHRYCSVQ